jgi:tRNA modification GTPase
VLVPQASSCGGVDEKPASDRLSSKAAMRSNDTIFAAASGLGRSAVCVIRISGPHTRAVLEALAGGLPAPRHLALRRMVEPGTGEPLDQALVAWMPAPNSFTGEDQAELHIHGGLATRTAVLRALGTVTGCRMAEPGEFTRRAFLNGRMDLSGVEGLADLIDAETEAQRRQALRQLEGRLGSLVETWRARLIEALALLEAALDFSDEGDVPATLEGEAAAIVAEVNSAMRRSLADGQRGERLRDGFVVVLAGPPNAGKSTLLNALAQRDVAIVSPFAGTTRDAIEVRCDLLGLPVTFVDTAGLRDSADPIEREGVARTRARLGSADLVLWLVAPDLPAEAGPAGNVPILRVGTKADLCGANRDGVDLTVSAATGAGIADLLDRIGREAETALGAGDAVLTRERHRRALETAQAALARAQAALTEGVFGELAAEDVRLALRALGAITGRVDVEDILDRLFATFCIGK